MAEGRDIASCPQYTDQLQIGEETPIAVYPKGQTPTANSIERSATTRDNPSQEIEELEKLLITGPAGDDRFLSAGGKQAN